MRHQLKEIIKKRLILALIILVFIASNAQKSKEGFSLIGTTNGIENGTYLYLVDVSKEKVIDSAKVENNSFYFQTKLSKSPLNAVLRTKDLTKKNSQIRFLWVENNKMNFDGTKTDLAHATITGSVTEALKQAFRKEVEGLPLNERRQKEMEFVKNNPNSIASASVLSVYKTTWPKEKIKELFELFSLENKNSDYGKGISKYLELNKSPVIGDKYIDFEMEDTNGKKKKLSDFKGKIILLEFWASNCAPCRKENPNLVKIYEKYHPKGFEVFAVSQDINKTNWLNAIQKDKLPWIQVSDLKGGENSALLIYGINAIPWNFLIDKDGTIIDKNLRGDNLNKKLAEIIP
jgi:peroxiredoxin